MFLWSIYLEFQWEHFKDFENVSWLSNDWSGCNVCEQTVLLLSNQATMVWFIPYESYRMISLISTSSPFWISEIVNLVLGLVILIQESGTKTLAQQAKKARMKTKTPADNDMGANGRASKVLDGEEPCNRPPSQSLGWSQPNVFQVTL